MREERGGAGKGPRQKGEGGGAGQGRGRNGFGGPARGPAAGPERSRGYGGGPAGREARDGGDAVRTGPPEDLIYGRNPVLEALRKGRPITRVWLAKESKDRVGAEAAALCHQANIPFKYVDRPFLDHLCWNGLHQGLAAQAAPKEYVEWESMLELAKAKGQQPLLVILDEVEDPHNLGAILRSADALGAHGVVIPKRRAVPLTAGVSRASAGALEYVAVARVTNLNQTIEKMKEAGLWVMGASASARDAIYDVDWTGPVALVLGGEDKGISRLVEENCDALVRIPMEGNVNSLNVSASGAIILSEIKRQRLNAAK